MGGRGAAATWVVVDYGVTGSLSAAISVNTGSPDGGPTRRLNADDVLSIGYDVLDGLVSHDTGTLWWLRLVCNETRPTHVVRPILHRYVR